MARVVLLPNREAAPSWATGVAARVFNRDEELPRYWSPEIGEAQRTEDVDAFAFPTPFAWAEMMAAVIRQRRYDHHLFKLYDYLVRGLVLGHLELQVVDLRGPAGGKFGAVLAATDENFRYFGLLRGAGDARGVPAKVFGATSPESLFWPSPRRTEADWQALDAAITRGGHLDDAYQVLADFRALLERAGLWDPNSSHAPWMVGLNQILNAPRRRVEPSAGHKHFHVHSQLAGPVRVRWPDGEFRHLYLPVYREKFAASFLRALTGSFAREGDSVALYDSRRRKCYEIRASSRPGEDAVLAGAGTVRVLDEPAEELNSTQIRLRDLFSLVQDLHSRLGNDVEDTKRHPFFYPDVFRVTVSRLGEAGLGEDVSFSDQAYRLTFDPDSPGLPLESELTTITDETRGVVLPYRDERGQQRKAIYVDSYAGASIGDLRALGWVLWAYFTGEAEVRDGRLLDDELTPIFKETNSARPFDLRDDIYARVSRDGGRHRRLATLQRFLNSYAAQGARLADGEDRKVSQLCYQAASAFVRWVWPDRSFLANGHLGRSSQPVKHGNLQLVLERDE